MKKSLLTLAAGSLLAALPVSGQNVIAFWDFNDGYDFANDVPQIVHGASLGSGTLYQQRADTDGNGKGGNAFSQSGFDGSISSINVSDGKSMAWNDIAKSGANDAEIFITFATSGFQDIEISFDIEGNDGAGIATYDVKYDFNELVDVTDPGDVSGTIKDFDGGNSTDFLNNTSAPGGINDPEAFVRESIAFGSALDDQSFVAVRLDDFQDNDKMSIDNVLVTGTVVPEPASFGTLAGALALGFAALRRRRS
ncbi:MAG: PEP-CTERM sorting domain-containing protein [Opitutales bacterium]